MNGGPSRDGGEPRRRRLLLESLEVIADEPVAIAIVDNALAMAGRTDVPTIPDGLATFVSGHLLDAIEAALGVDASDRFEDAIDALLRAASVEHESQPVPNRGTQGRLVLVTSRDAARVEALRRALARHADVESVEPSALPPMLWARLASAVVLDCATSAIDPSAVDEIIASMGDGRVVLWGAPPEVERTFALAHAPDPKNPGAKRGTWLSCARGAGPAHVASLVLALLTD